MVSNARDSTQCNTGDGDCMIPIEKVICGGQSGGDLAGAYFAKKYGIPLDINICAGFKPIGRTAIPPELTLEERWVHGGRCRINDVTTKTGTAGLLFRNEFNVRGSDFTVILLDTAITLTKGSYRTSQFCNRHGRAYFELYVKGAEHHARLYKGGDYSPRGCLAAAVLYNEWYLLNSLTKFVDLVQSKLKTGFIVNIAGTRKLDEQLGIEALELLFERR